MSEVAERREQLLKQIEFLQEQLDRLHADPAVTGNPTCSTADADQADEVLQQGEALKQGETLKQGEACLFLGLQQQFQSELAQVIRISTVSELVGGLAHELNQPLYTIQNYGKACRNLVANNRTFDPDQIIEWLDEITSTAEYAGELLGRLRGFVKSAPVDRVRIDLRGTLEAVVALARQEAQQRGVRLELSMTPDLPTVIADPVQIQQVVVNLLRNALEALEQHSHGAPQITITAQKRDDAVEVRVADNGPGLPTEHGAKIFEAFQSTKPTRLGLGLAAGKTIIEAHNGTLDAETDPAGGAVFGFTLPIGEMH